MLYLLSLFPFLVTSNALVTPRQLSNPTVKSSNLVGVVSDPTLTRDSGGSVQWGSRALWTYRDTGILDSQGQQVSFFSSSASYTNINANGTIPFSPVPADQPQNQPYPAAYLQYGENNNEQFFKNLPQECGNNTGGNCYNGSRVAVWPDYPPLVTSQSGTLTGYTWIKRSLITFLTLDNPQPPATLYKITGTDDQQDLPSVSVVGDGTFWEQGYFAYGAYGNLIKEDMAYLFASSDERNNALARVPLTSIEDKSAYEYYVGGQWISTAPLANDTSAFISIAGGQPGQGTFYYSEPWNQYVWIGQPGGCACTEFIVSVASCPEGPWTASSHVIDVPPGNYPGIGAYSMQAHPEFKPGPEENSIYLTYTQQNNGTAYETPLYLIEWN